MREAVDARSGLKNDVFASVTNSETAIATANIDRTASKADNYLELHCIYCFHKFCGEK